MFKSIFIDYYTPTISKELYKNMKIFKNTIDSRTFENGDLDKNTYSHSATTARPYKITDDKENTEIFEAYTLFVEKQKSNLFILYSLDEGNSVPLRDCSGLSISLQSLETGKIFKHDNAKLYVHKSDEFMIFLELPKEYRKEDMFFIQDFIIMVVTNKKNYKINATAMNEATYIYD